MSAEVYFLIGIAAERAGMHPQTLRVYERRGLITPRRSKGRTRLYSAADVALLRRIQELSDEGLNLAGIERVLRLERRAEQEAARADRAERRAADLEAELADVREAHRRQREEERRRACRELVRVTAPGPTALVLRYAPVVTKARVRTRRGGDG